MNFTKLTIAVVFSVSVLPALIFAQFGTGANSGSKPIPKIHMSRITPFLTQSNTAPRNSSVESATVQMEYTIRGEHPNEYQAILRQKTSHIREIHDYVDQLKRHHLRNQDQQTEQALVQELNYLQGAEADLEQFKRTWNHPVTATFDGKSVDHKAFLLERAFQLGLQGKSITFGPKKVTLFHGKPNFSRSEDITHLFR